MFDFIVFIPGKFIASHLLKKKLFHLRRQETKILFRRCFVTLSCVLNKMFLSHFHSAFEKHKFPKTKT